MAEKTEFKELMNIIGEKFKDLRGERWDEALKVIFFMFLNEYKEEELKSFLKEHGWENISDVEDACEEYIEELFPELNDDEGESD